MIFIITFTIINQVNFALAEGKSPLKEGRISSQECKIPLQDALKIAFKNNNDFKASKYMVLAKNEEINIQRSNYFPKLKVAELFASTNNPTVALSYRLNQRRAVTADLAINALNFPAPINNYLTSIFLEQPVYNKKLMTTIAIAKTDLSSQNYDHMKNKEELVLRVIKSYLEVNKNTKLAQTAKKNLEETKENVKLAELKFKNKTGYNSAILRTKTAVNEAEQDLIQHTNDLDITKRALGLAIGLEESIDTIESTVPKLSLQDISYYNIISKTRNDIKSMELKYENSKNNIKLAQADYYPTLDFNGGYEFWDPNAPFTATGQNYVVGGFLRWDAFNQTRHYEKTKAQYKANEVCENLNSLKKTVGFQVYEAFINVNKAKSRLDLNKTSVKNAEEARKIVFEKYETVLLPVIDLLDVQYKLNELRDDLTRSEIEYDYSLFNLSFQSGNILKDLDIK